MKRETWLLLLAISILCTATRATGQDFSGNWQGTNYSKGSATAEYWPVSLTLTQNGNSLSGTMHFSAKDLPQYFVTFDVTGRVTGPNSFWLDITKIVAENKEDDNNYWCVGSGNFSLDRTGEKFTGTIDFTNCPFKGQTELFRLELTTEDTYCAPSTADLHVTGSNVRWYSDQDKTRLLARGNDYSVQIEESVTFYVTQTHYNTESPVLPVRIEAVEIDFEATARTECGAPDGTISLTSDNRGIRYRLNGGEFSGVSSFGDLSPGSYTVTGRADGCELTKEVVVEARSAPAIDRLETEEAGCTGNDGSVTVIASSGTPPLRYSIDGAGLQDSNRFSGLGPGSFVIRVQDSEGCAVSETAQVTAAENVLEISRVETEDPGCDRSNGSIRVEAAGGNGQVTYSLDGRNYQPDPVFDSLSPNEYTVYARDAGDCISQTSVTLNPAVPLAELVYLKSNTSCGNEDGSIEITAPHAADVTYSINSGAPSPTRSYYNLGPGSYHIRAEGEAGCTTETVVEIVSDCVVPVRFPNAISPNGDAVNESFTAFFGEERLRIARFSVFNRWGNVIFSRENFEIQSGEMLWDGKAASRSASAGVYAYLLEVSFTEELSHTYRGFVQIIP